MNDCLKYNLQCKWLEANPRTKCRAKEVKDTLLACGFGYAWYNQCVGNIPLFLVNLKNEIEILRYRVGLTPSCVCAQPLTREDVGLA